MHTVKVNASSEYEVKIGAGLLDYLGREAAAVTKVGTAVLISDQTVWNLYGKQAQESLENAGFSVLSLVFQPGESTKCASSYLELLEFLAKSKVTRSDCLIALGGGVIGDLVGFTAATYLRGIPFVQVPTTLLAAVDSSVGGKTAINLESGKNLVGAFYQPKLVLCDTDTLNTLPNDIFQDGCAEVIKYGILYDESLFGTLQKDGLDFDREAVIARCVELKRDVVAEDEFDTGSRMKLNLGHTVGHAIEKISGYSVSHGKAVAIGTSIVCRSAAASGFCSRKTAVNIEKLFLQFGLPIGTEYDCDALFDAALSDKKRSGGTVNLIVPRTIGDCVIQPTPVEDLKTFIKEGL